MSKNYNDVYELKSEIARKIDQAYSAAYDRGYGDGFNHGREQMVSCEEYRESVDKAYHKGLDEAWECARKIVSDERDGGVDAHSIFNTCNVVAIINGYDASEAMEKIKEWKEASKVGVVDEADDEFNVGDVIEYTGSTDTFRAVIISKTRSAKGDTYIRIMYSDCSTDHQKLGDIPWVRTGEHLDIQSIMTALGKEDGE